MSKLLKRYYPLFLLPTLLAFLVVFFVPFLMGSLIGLLAGYYGGWVDALVMRIQDIVTAFPFTILIIAIITILGPNISNLYIAVWLVGWKDYTKLVRSEVLAEKNLDYVQAARVMGFSGFRIMVRHILPNTINSAIVYAVSDVMMCMLVGASMSFLGLGVQPPIPEWGAIITEGRPYIMSAWWICTFPATGLPHDSQYLSCRHLERHAVYSMNRISSSIKASVKILHIKQNLL